MLRYFFQIFNGGGPIQIVVALLIFGFMAWMFVDAVRRGEYIWAAFIVIGWGLSAVLYYFMVYRPSGGMGNPLTGFELPGAADRRQIKALQASIHHLDKPHLHLQLGDIYFNQDKLDLAEQSYRAAYERDPNDIDIRAHLGSCLVRRGKTAEALPLLQAAVAQNPRHDYGYTLMTYAEALTAAGQVDAAMATWKQVLSLFSYSRAKVQYAQLLADRKNYAEARELVRSVIEDEPYEPTFQRKREKVWLSRAKSLQRSLPAA